MGVLDAFKTVGTYILYEDTLAFMIGPDNSGEKLGIMRLGGHIEKGESYLQALEREVNEEGAIRVKLVSSTDTYYKTNWDDTNYCKITNDIAFDIKPLIVTGNIRRSTAVFLAYAEEEPKPSSEAHGIIFLNKSEIKDICSKKLRLKDFLNNGGKLIQQKEIDYNMEMYAGVHLKFLYNLIENNNGLVQSYMKGELI